MRYGSIANFAHSIVLCPTARRSSQAQHARRLTRRQSRYGSQASLDADLSARPRGGLGPRECRGRVRVHQRHARCATLRRALVFPGLTFRAHHADAAGLGDDAGKDTRTPEYLEKSGGIGTVPMLEDDGFFLSE